VLDARRRVHLFGDDQRLRLEIERNRCVRAGAAATASRRALRGFHAADRIHHGLQMLGRCAAAAADNAHAVVLDKVLVIFRQFLPASSL
jgi:hypothetical protein